MATQVWQVQESTPLEQRRSTRHALSIVRATVRGIGRDPGEAKLLDLSIYGCRLAVTSEHDEGDRLWLRFDGGWPIAACVVWAEDGRVGCRFDEAIPGSMMRELTRALI